MSYRRIYDEKGKLCEVVIENEGKKPYHLKVVNEVSRRLRLEDGTEVIEQDIEVDLMEQPA